MRLLTSQTAITYLRTPSLFLAGSSSALPLLFLPLLLCLSPFLPLSLSSSPLSPVSIQHSPQLLSFLHDFLFCVCVLLLAFSHYSLIHTHSLSQLLIYSLHKHLSSTYYRFCHYKACGPLQNR